MGKRPGVAAFIFRRDMRIVDNTALLKATSQFKQVLPAFIFDPTQVDGTKNGFFSGPGLQFMLECLDDLATAIKARNGRLYFFYGRSADIVEKLLDLKIQAVFVNKDYTPFSLERDKKLEQLCLSHSAEFHSFEDLLLHPVEQTLKPDSKNPYTIFTPFYKNASSFPVSKPVVDDLFDNFFVDKLNFEIEDYEAFKQKLLPQRYAKCLKGGRKECQKIVENLPKFANYSTERDVLALQGTTQLSAYLKFNVCSVREIYHAALEKLGKQKAEPLTRQLFWRDFYTQIAFYFPKVFTENFREKYNALQWVPNDEAFEKWCQGKTGFPVVDAGMRQLNETGYMHNRARMIVASFLVKDLHIDWRLGEKYFAQHLVDYDPCLNNGNWQWTASTGCDPQPYFRIFNPWLQSAKFDPDAVYIKKWVPELSDVPAAKIHKWYIEENRKGYSKHNYPAPVVDHWKESKTAIAYFKAC